MARVIHHQTSPTLKVSHPHYRRPSLPALASLASRSCAEESAYPGLSAGSWGRYESLGDPGLTFSGRGGGGGGADVGACGEDDDPV